MFIGIEGIDRSGKDSFLIAFDKKTKWHNCDMMRGPAGCFYYDEFYNRGSLKRTAEAIQVAEAIKSTKHLILFFYADPEDIEKRLKEEGKTVREQFEHQTIEEAIQEYRKALYELYSPFEVLEINSSKMTVDEEVDLVMNKVEEIRRMDMQLIPDESAISVQSPNKGTYDYIQYRPFRSIYTAYDMIYKTFDIEIDRPYYEMLDAALTHKVYLHTLGWVNDRQVIYVAEDCIPFVQIMIDKNDNTVRYIVHQRSCDIEKHHFNDVVFFWWWNQKSEFKNMKFTLDYSCSYPHRYIPRQIDFV